jgi:hypothetical protein
MLQILDRIAQHEGGIQVLRSFEFYHVFNTMNTGIKTFDFR